MKKITLIIFVCFNLIASSQLSIAQNNPVTYSNNFNLQKCIYQPSSLGQDSSRININIPFLPNLYGWVSNNVLTTGKIMEFTNNDKKISNKEVNNEVSTLKDNNNLAFGLYYQPIAFSIKLSQPRKDSLSWSLKRRSNKELVTLSLDIMERIEFNTFFNKKLIQLLWQGNAQYEGQRIDMGNLGINGFWHRDFGLGMARDLYNDKDISIRAGFKVKYIVGMASIYTAKAGAKLTTLNSDIADINAKNTLEVDYKINTSHQNNFLGKSSGNGIGLDLGTTFAYKQNMFATISLLDLGSVTYKNYTTNYQANTKIDMEGEEVKLDENVNTTLDKGFISTTQKKLEGQKTHDAYGMPLPSRIMIALEYKLDNKRDSPKHHFFLNYIQGITNIGVSTKRMSLNIAYSYNLTSKFGVCSIVGLGGYNDFNCGMYISGRLGWFNYGLGSSNLLSLFSRRISYGADLSLSMGISIGR